MKMKSVLLDDRYFLGLALKQARKSVKECGFPAGAIVVKCPILDILNR
jgi:tRNA(Arg) A34 adenosine deaminase TadA